MAFKLVSGSKVPTQEPQENVFGRTARQVGALPIRAIEGLLGAPQDIYSGVVGGLVNPAIQKLTGKENVLPGRLQSPVGLPWPGSQDIREQFTNKFIAPNLPQGYLEPQGPGEQFAHNIAGDPTVALRGLATGGASLPADIARSAATQVGSQGAKTFGLGPMGQFLGGVLGGFGFDLKAIGGTPGSLPKVAQKQYTKDYAVAKKIAPKLTAQAPQTAQRIDELIQTVGERGKSAINKDIYRVLNNARSKISKDNTMNVKELWDLKKELGDYLHAAPQYEKAFYNKLIGPVKADLEDISKLHPDFGVPYQRAEDLWKAVNLRSEIGDMIEQNTGLKNLFKNKTTNAILGAGLGYKFGAPALVGGIAAGYPLRYAARAADFFKGHPNAQALMGQALKEAAENNTVNFGNTIRLLKQEYDNFEKQQPDRKSRFKQIS